MRLRLMYPRSVHEGIKGTEFVSWSRPLPPSASFELLIATRRMMFFVAIVQFALSTGHVITIVVQLVRGFGGTSTNTPYLLNQATPEHLAQEFIYITNVRSTMPKFYPNVAHWRTDHHHYVIRVSSAMPF